MIRMLTVVGAIALVASAGCEKKEPAAPAPAKSTTDSIKEAAKTSTDAVKDTAAKATEAVKDTAAKATEAASAAWAKVQDSAKGYIDTLTQTNGVMEGVKDAPSATTALPKLKDLLPKLTAQGGALSALGTEDRAKLMSEYKDKLTPLVTKFKAEIDRLTKNPGIAAILGDTLKSVKLFE
ncbi:MAG: hypothetical protein IT436_07895 [Phycisphaerales bacterium]|nr:hypothetical protein [Phycisphaerales bacterium]